MGSHSVLVTGFPLLPSVGVYVDTRTTPPGAVVLNEWMYRLLSDKELPLVTLNNLSPVWCGFKDNVRDESKT